MDFRLVGGKDNNSTIVDLEGNAHVIATTRLPVTRASWRGEAYRVLAEIDLSGTAQEACFWLRNDRAGRDRGRIQSLLVDRMILSADANVHVELWVDVAYTSGGGDAQLIALNRGESGTADVTAKDGTTSLVLDKSTATEMQSLFIGAYAPFREQMNGRLILPKNKAIAVYAQGAAGNKVRIELDFYWDTEPE